MKDLLRGDPLLLWTNPAARQAALQAIVTALETSPADTQRSLARVDTAVAEALQVVGFPRGPIRAIMLESRPFGPAGHKESDCTLVINAAHVAGLLGMPRGADTAFRTWTHESIHGRQPYANDYSHEYDRWPGYEEGLAEALARLVVREIAGLDPIQVTYDYYVTTYRTIAHVARVDLQSLLRDLWISPLGRVRASLSDAIDDLRQQHGNARLTPRQHQDLRALADAMFGADRSGQRRMRML